MKLSSRKSQKVKYGNNLRDIHTRKNFRIIQKINRALQQPGFHLGWFKLKSVSGSDSSLGISNMKINPTNCVH